MADYTDGPIADEMRLLLDEDDARAAKPDPDPADYTQAGITSACEEVDAARRWWWRRAEIEPDPVLRNIDITVSDALAVVVRAIDALDSEIIADEVTS